MIRLGSWGWSRLKKLPDVLASRKLQSAMNNVRADRELMERYEERLKRLVLGSRPDSGVGGTP